MFLRKPISRLTNARMPQIIILSALPNSLFGAVESNDGDDDVASRGHPRFLFGADARDSHDDDSNNVALRGFL